MCIRDRSRRVMFEILHGVNVDWMKRRHLAFLFSGACVLISILSLILHGGPRYGVDFTGGSLVGILVTPPVHADRVRSAVDQAGYRGSEIQELSRPGQFLVLSLIHISEPTRLLS